MKLQDFIDKFKDDSYEKEVVFMLVDGETNPFLDPEFNSDEQKMYVYFYRVPDETEAVGAEVQHQAKVMLGHDNGSG